MPPLLGNPFLQSFFGKKQEEEQIKQELASKMAQQQAQQQEAKSAAIQKAQSVIGP